MKKIVTTLFAVLISPLFVACSKGETLVQLPPYPGATSGRAQLERLGATSLYLNSPLAIYDHQERFCSILGPRLRVIVNRNPELTCLESQAHTHGHEDEVEVKAMVPWVRAFDIRGDRARLISVSCYQVSPPPGQPPIVATSPRFARARFFRTGEIIGPGMDRGGQPALLRLEGRSRWLLDQFFEELPRDPSRREIRLALALYKQMQEEEPDCPLPNSIPGT